jgi:ankyrin repeat protein
LEEVKQILQEGVNVNCIDENGSTPFLSLLGTEKKNGHENLIEIVQLLIQHGLDVKCENNNGSNALTLLFQFYQKENFIEIAQLLIENGCEVTPDLQTRDEISQLLTYQLAR